MTKNKEKMVEMQLRTLMVIGVQLLMSISIGIRQLSEEVLSAILKIKSRKALKKLLT